MAKPKNPYAFVINESRRRLHTVTQGKPLARMKAIYDTAQKDLAAKLKAQAGKDTPFTHYHLNLMMAQVRDGQAQLAKKMVGHLGKEGRAAQAIGLRGTIDDVKRLSKAFGQHMPVLRVEEAARFAGVLDDLAPSLLSLHRRSVARYTADVVKKAQDQLAVSQVNGDSMDNAIGKVEKLMDVEYWQASRIVRTEQAWAYNGGARDGLEELDKELPGGLWMRWIEHCTDSPDPQPLDDRVGDDSLAMHGQVVKPGGLFTMPDDDPRVPKGLVGKSWQGPPNRPNDRSIVVAWQPGWGGYAWEWRNGRRVVLSE
jgi:hypothetical protein